jgi:predicted site-specific integrase-resolvase
VEKQGNMLHGKKSPQREIPKLVDTREAAEILGRSAATLKRWRHEGIGPNWIEMEGRVSYDVSVLLEFIRRNTRVASVRAAMEEAREAV